MSVNSGLKATKIIGQTKAFYRQRILEFSCGRKDTFDIAILETSRNGDESTSLEKKEVEPIELVLKNIYQSNTYRKDLSWSYFENEPRVQEKQQVRDQQSCIFIFVACLAIPSSNKGHQPRHNNSIPYKGIW